MEDITGNKYGRLTALRYAYTENGKQFWEFKCDCGATVTKALVYAKTGHTKSCGCLHKEQLAQRNKDNAKHGGWTERLYGVWHGMKERCLTPTNKDYRRYGARGITVCKEWADSYLSFKNWALANGYDPDAKRGACTLDRINNDKGYSPDNCRWVNAKTQALNRRKGYEIYNLKRKTENRN